MALPPSSQLWLCLAALLCLLFSPCLATVYTVGGSAGWTANYNYTQWAANISFTVGDSLEFNYVYQAHTVLEVIRSDFRFCNKTNPLESYSDVSGKTVVALSIPGNYYFIDGVGQNCEAGQKFEAKVSAGMPAATTPSEQPSASPSVPPATAAASTLSSTSILVLFIAMLSGLLM